MLSFTIPIPEKVSTNLIYQGVHWTKRKKLADLYHKSLIEHRLKRVIDYPVDVSYIFSFKGRTLDPDNTSYMAKMLKDSMRKWSIIKDDTSEYVSSVTLVSKKGLKDEVQIIIT